MKVLSRKFAFLFGALILAISTSGCGFTSHEAAMTAPCGSPFTAEPASPPQYNDPPLPKIGFVLVMS